MTILEKHDERVKSNLRYDPHKTNKPLNIMGCSQIDIYLFIYLLINI